MDLMTDLVLFYDFPKTSQISSDLLFVGYVKCQWIVCDITNTINVPYLVITDCLRMCHLVLIRKY